MGNGGGLTVSGGRAVVRNSIFRYNSAIYGGAIYSRPTNIHLDTVTIDSNSASQAGGGIYIHTKKLGNQVSQSVVWTSITVINNTALVQGGGIAFHLDLDVGTYPQISIDSASKSLWNVISNFSQR